MSWFKQKQLTGDLQFIKKITEDKYKVINIYTFISQDNYCFSEYDINLSDYSEDYLNIEVEDYYYDLRTLKKDNKKNWKLRIVGIIAENMTDVQYIYQSKEDMKIALLQTKF